MIKVENLTKSFIHNGKKINILRNVSFEIKKGESIALLGRNGSGKSTLLNILGGIDQPDSGTIERDCSVSWPVGLVGGFQGSLSARENTIFVSKIYAGLDKDIIKQKVKFVEEFAEIGDYFDRPFKTYSSGMRSRVTFGLSMAFNFDTYLIDEITSAGDARFRKKSAQYLEQKTRDADFIVVDHNLTGLTKYCNRAFLLNEGNLIEYGDVNEGIIQHKKILER